VRQLFSAHPRLFRRGAWGYFYRDRDFAPFVRKKQTFTTAELGGAVYNLSRRPLIARPRQTQRSQWYGFRNISRRVRTVLSKRHRSLGCLINRRLRAQRQLVCGAIYAFQGSLQPVFSTKANLQRSLRRLHGRRVHGRRQRYRSIGTQTLPRVVRLHPPTNRRVTPSMALVGGRLDNTLLRKSTRPLWRALCPSRPKLPRRCFTYELQQELSAVTTYQPAQVLPHSKRDVQPVVSKKAMHVYTRRFARKAYRAVE
jgi:hypothetical protein